MKMRLLLLSALLTTIFLLPGKTSGQDLFSPTNVNEASQVETDSVALQAFPIRGITREFGATNRLVTEAEDSHLSQEDTDKFNAELDSLIADINEFLADSSLWSLENLSSRELDQIIQQNQFYLDQNEDLMNRLTKFSSELENQGGLLQANRRRWQLTLSQDVDDETLEARSERITSTIQSILAVENLLQDDLLFIIDAQDKLSGSKTELETLMSALRDQKLALGEALFKRDVPGFFKDLSNLGNARLMHSHWEEFRKSVSTDLDLLKSGYRRSMIFSLLMFFAVVAFTTWFRKNHSKVISEDKFKLSELHLIFINSPVASSLFFITLMIRFLIPDLPRTFFVFNIMIMLIPMGILMVRVYGAIFRTWVIVLIIAAIINLIYELSYHPGVLLRILLLGMSLVGIWIFGWIYRNRPYKNLVEHRNVYRFFRVLVVVFMIMQVLSIIANLAGTFMLAEFFAMIPLQIAISAISIQLATKFGDAILYLSLASNYVQKLNVVRQEFQVIYRKISWLIHFILLLTFIGIALNILSVGDLFYEWGRGVLSDGINIGAIKITLGSILIFVFVIWLSIVLTRIISHILEKDVFTRVKAAKGVPGTIILMLKIVLISAGFFLAAAASGMHLTNLSIVLGAFSVGIGFGLQNIFNNMVSGLILAFERPISVGDVVQVGQLMGTVRSIGLRSSTVKSFDGAEVIVPNGNLISNEMINWTLSDENRRMDLRIGVAYGTSPETVLAILEKIGAEHPQVMQKPSPKAYFIEFGDSSLNFRLLAWAKLDNRLEVESEINVLINQKLAEAGIEIPFPQRDLHIKSDTTKGKQ